MNIPAVLTGAILMLAGIGILAKLQKLSDSFDDSPMLLRPIGSKEQRPLVLGATALGLVGFGVVFIFVGLSGD